MQKFLALLGCALCFMVSYGHAEQTSLLVFGDSLSDTGAGYALSPTVSTPPNAIPPTPPYYDHRYSDGPNWVDYTASNLHATVQNYAVGGAETGTDNVLAAYPMGGLLTEIGRFASLGQPISSDTVTIVEIGSNDFLSLLNSLPTPPTAGQLVVNTLTALGDVNAAVQELQSLGSDRTIVWNLPDLYEIPLIANPFFGLQALIPYYEAASALYNPQLLQEIVGLNVNAAPHQSVFYFDAAGVFEEVRNQLISQGIDPLDFNYYTVFSNPVSITPVQAYTPNTAFFDQEHPSSLGWKLFAKEFSAYIDTITNSHRVITAQQELIFSDYRAYRSLIENHFRTLHRQFYVCPTTCDDLCEPTCYQVYVDALGKWGDVKNNHHHYGSRYNTQLVSIGMDYFYNNCLTAGVSFAAQRNKAHINNDWGRIDLKEYIPTFYASYTDPCYFVDFDLSYRYIYFQRIARRIPFVCRETKGRATGWGIATGLQGGYLYNWCTLNMGPIYGLNYESALIHAYNERNSKFENLHVGGQHQDSLLGKVGWQVFFDECEFGVSPYADVNYHYQFLRCNRTLNSHFTHVNDRSTIRNKVGAIGNIDYLTYDIGFDFNILDWVRGNVAYEGEWTFHNYNNSVIAELNANY